MNPLAMKISFAILAGEIVSCLYFSSICIPVSLQQSFRQAEEETALAEIELSCMESWNIEHQYPYEALSTLLYAKSENVSFHHLQIGDFGEGAWIRAEITGKDTSTLDTYLSSLESSGLLQVQIKDRRTDGNMETLGIEIRRQMP